MVARARMSDIPLPARWSLDAVWEIERQRIDVLINAQSETCSENNVALVANATWGEIRNSFSVRSSIEPALRMAAEAGELERNAGSRFWILALRLVLAFLIFTEMAVFGFVWMVGRAYAFVVIQGLILGAGAWLLGWGLARVAAMKETEARLRWDTALAMIAMLIGIMFVSSTTALLVRFSSEASSTIIAVTLPIALLIVVLENLQALASLRYVLQRKRMFQAQVQYADAHHGDMQESRSESWIENLLRAMEVSPTGGRSA
jgi:hypothetical protein